MAGEAAGDQEAKMLTPGAAMSGFNTVAEMELGPREEKNATSGDICCPITVFVKLNFTTGFLLDSMYVSTYVPIAKSTWIQGMSKDKVTSLVGDCANIRPTPLTSNTVLLAMIFDLCDRDSKHRITFPLAKVAFRLPEAQPLALSSSESSATISSP